MGDFRRFSEAVHARYREMAKGVQDSMIGIERAAKRMDDACRAAAKRMDDAWVTLDLVKDIIATKQRAAAEALARQHRSEERRRLLDAIAAKKDQVLSAASLERGTAMTNTKAREELLAAILLAYRQQQHPLPDSDLDDEQPVALSVRTTLGHLRALKRLARAGGGS